MTPLNEFDEMLLQWAEGVIERIKGRLDSTGTTASGRTKESLEAVLTDSGVQILGRPYFQGVEIGRPAGRIPYNMTQIIRQWMEDKGISSQFGSTEAQKRSAAYLIGQFIKNNGTRLYREGGRDDIYTDVIEEELPKLFQNIDGRVAESLLRL